MKDREDEKSIYNEFVTKWKIEWHWMDPCANDVNDGYMATCETSTDPCWNQTHDLRNASQDALTALSDENSWWAYLWPFFKKSQKKRNQNLEKLLNKRTTAQTW